MSNYKGLFTFDVDNHRYVSVEQADGLISDMNYHPEPKKEPKDYYFIDGVGAIQTTDRGPDDELAKQMQSIGNYFETKEEAEKAVEKLKAWKRLKDKGFKFESVEGYKALCGNGFNIPITATMPPAVYADDIVGKDLDICFGGKE